MDVQISRTVFQYSDPRAYLSDAFSEIRARRPQFSLRAWAKQMGFKNHSLLHFLMTGKRPIRSRHMKYLVRGLRLTPDEQRYLETLVLLQSAQSPSEKLIYENLMREVRPEAASATVDVDAFATISAWYPMAILEMTQLRDFQEDPVWISKRLGHRITTGEIREALERLQRLGLLTRDASGRLQKTHVRLTTPKTHGSEAIRRHHKEILSLATESIEAQSPQERVLNSCAMTVNSERLPEALELITKFRKDLAALMESASGDQTYELSVQFFRLTESIGSAQTGGEA